MITYIDDILDPKELLEMLLAGYVQERHHPEYPYTIYCYTKAAMFDRVWNNTTRTCRGLIVNEDTGEVLARPFAKFFNYGEPNAAEFKPDDWVTVYDKVDGSLGIAYETPDGPAIATKGSFTSEQALAATELLRGQYGRYSHDDVHTDLFEIILPENRIVLDYGDEKSLRYLGSVDISDGSAYWNGLLMRIWGIPRNMPMLQGTFEGVLGAIDLERPNAEGVVLFNDFTGERLKMKQQDYIELHKVMTGLNERQLWQWLSEGRRIEDVLKDLPEEIHPWARDVMWELSDEHRSIEFNYRASFQYHSELSTDRKDFARRIKDYPSLGKGVMFCMLDGQFERADALIWKALKP